MPVVEVLASAMLVARVIALDSLHTRLATTQKKRKTYISKQRSSHTHGTMSNLLHDSQTNSFPASLPDIRVVASHILVCKLPQGTSLDQQLHLLPWNYQKNKRKHNSHHPHNKTRMIAQKNLILDWNSSTNTLMWLSNGELWPKNILRQHLNQQAKLITYGRRKRTDHYRRLGTI